MYCSSYRCLQKSAILKDSPNKSAVWVINFLFWHFTFIEKASKIVA